MDAYLYQNYKEINIIGVIIFSILEIDSHDQASVEEFYSHSFGAVYREGNMCADKLAGHAHFVYFALISFL